MKKKNRRLSRLNSELRMVRLQKQKLTGGRDVKTHVLKVQMMDMSKERK